jgi:hypothetical protein
MIHAPMPRAIEWGEDTMGMDSLRMHFKNIIQYWPDKADKLDVSVFDKWVKENHSDQLNDNLTYPIGLINQYVNVELDIMGSFVLID